MAVGVTKAFGDPTGRHDVINADPEEQDCPTGE